MQEEVRNVVLSYLRAQEVPFVWRDGFVDVPDARRISELASGRPSLSLTFDREVAALLPDVDYVTFGHPLFDQILEKLRDTAVFVERFYGLDVHAVLGDGDIPFLTWQDHVPGASTTPYVEPPRTIEADILYVRLQLDIESDFRHVETFGIPVDLAANAVVPERAAVARRSPQRIPSDLALREVPEGGFERAIARACDHARSAAGSLLEVKRAEAEKRMTLELAAAREGGLSTGQVAHLERELGRKYNVTARLQVVGVERWLVHVGLQFTVRLLEWAPDAVFSIRYDHEARRTHVEATGKTGTPDASTHLRLCWAKHADDDRAPLEPCSECGKRFCSRHVATCDASGARSCDAELGTCDDQEHGGRRVLRRLVRPIGSQTYCPKHVGVCADCGASQWTRQLATCASSKAVICFQCSIKCGECGELVSVRRAPRCGRSDVALCAEHAVRCAEPECCRIVAPTQLLTVEGGRYCREHVGRCADGHAALLRGLSTCEVSKLQLCAKHIDVCSCKRMVARQLMVPSAASRKSTCPECRVECADCKRSFLAVETETCARTKRPVCKEDVRVCQHANCGKKVRRTTAIAFDGRIVCRLHALPCPENLEHSTLEDLLRGCNDAPCGNRVCPSGDHTCERCMGPICSTHVHWALGEKLLRTCPGCLFKGAACARCGAPLAMETTCPLCSRITSLQFHEPPEVPEAVRVACELDGVARGRQWRWVRSNVAQLWEQRVGVRLERFLVLANDSTVYRSTGGVVEGFFSMMKGS